MYKVSITMTLHSSGHLLEKKIEDLLILINERQGFIGSRDCGKDSKASTAKTLICHLSFFLPGGLISPSQKGSSPHDRAPDHWEHQTFTASATERTDLFLQLHSENFQGGTYWLHLSHVFTHLPVNCGKRKDGTMIGLAASTRITWLEWGSSVTP